MELCLGTKRSCGTTGRGDGPAGATLPLRVDDGDGENEAAGEELGDGGGEEEGVEDGDVLMDGGGKGEEVWWRMTKQLSSLSATGSRSRRYTYKASCRYSNSKITSTIVRSCMPRPSRHLLTQMIASLCYNQALTIHHPTSPIGP